ncbi:DUF3822 family protein [Sphingobacterium sp. SGG-5]|uniref:DUF3822 family protein n=1 Tax=Sphingobacterium sp. SGG-5 TaxID=2710881 RepID=UPI0013EB7166|nr:DUF3822 family protein [Sphingobacterium sp. SGG-5]NGM61474.1 DUF3822 family protein [Sphingobacterium sp. SGG-5]
MNYTAKEFRIQYVPTYTLYVNTDRRVDQLVIVDEDNQIMAYMSYDSAHPSQEAVKLLGLPFRTVYITLSHQHLIWIPSEIFDREGVEAFTSFFDGVAAEHIRAKSMPSLGVTALYTYDILQTKRWRSIFEEAKFIPVFAGLLNQVFPQVPLQGKILGVHVYDNRADLLVFIDGQFKFYNSFDIHAIDDLNYYVLHVFKSFGIDKRMDKIVLSGADIPSDQAECLAAYTDHLEILHAKNTWISSSAEVSAQTAGLNILIDSELCVS